MIDRERVGREARPSCAVLYAQGGALGWRGVDEERGCDPDQHAVERKCYLFTDTDGRLLVAAISPANLQSSS